MKYLKIIIVLFTIQTSIAQTIMPIKAIIDNSKVVKIEFDETGQMISAPTSCITDNTILMVIVNTREATYQNRIILAHNRYLTTLNNLNKMNLNGKSPAVLESLGLKNDENAKDILLVIENELSSEILKLLNQPKSFHILSKYYDVIKEIKDLQKFQLNFNDPNYSGINLMLHNILLKSFHQIICIPNIDSLIISEYLFHVKSSNDNGLQIKATCDATISFSIDPNNCCSLAYKSFFFKISNLGIGPVKFNFELRKSNDLFKQLLLQLKNESTIADYNNKLDTKRIDNILNFAFIPKNSSDNLINWIGIMEKKTSGNKKLDKTLQKLELLLVNDSNIKSDFDDIKDSLSITNINNALVPLKDPRAIAGLIQFAWLTHGYYFDANPIKNPFYKSTDGLNKKLDSIKRDSSFLAKKLIKDENISKQLGHTNFNTLTGDYNNLLLKARIIEDNIDALRDTLKKLKMASKETENINLNDSLLYSGFFYVNHQLQTSDLLELGIHPNKPYYAFTRNHNALEDYQLMGRDPIKQINEKQKMFRLIQNSKKPGNILLNETITVVGALDKLADDITRNNSQSSSSNPKSNNSYSTHKLTPLNVGSLKTLYNLYEVAKKATSRILAPYKNGILNLPLQPMRDTSANFYTNNLSNATEVFPNNTIAYLIDSTVDKNLKKQKLNFSFNVDKLYRFRLKAGIAYSWLETRNYNINPATNTATYVNNYIDLGPTIGIQIFTSKIDIQSPRVFPTGIYPFIYAGYLYNNLAPSNFLLGAGLEVFSGIAVTGGVHFGESQELTVVAGNLEDKGYFKGAGFVSITIGIEALSSIFSATSSLGTAFKIP